MEAEADGANFALDFEQIHGAERLFGLEKSQLVRGRGMRERNIELIGLQSPQGSLDASNRLLAGVVFNDVRFAVVF